MFATSPNENRTVSMTAEASGERIRERSYEIVTFESVLRRVIALIEED
jgi:hypothetical protein